MDECGGQGGKYDPKKGKAFTSSSSMAGSEPRLKRLLRRPPRALSGFLTPPELVRPGVLKPRLEGGSGEKEAEWRGDWGELARLRMDWEVEARKEVCGGEERWRVLA